MSARLRILSKELNLISQTSPMCKFAAEPQLCVSGWLESALMLCLKGTCPPSLCGNSFLHRVALLGLTGFNLDWDQSPAWPTVMHNNSASCTLS